MTQHSRVDSSGGVSVVSRESTVPLNGAEPLTTPPDVHRSPPSHPRTLSQGSEGLLLMRPLEPTVQGNMPSDPRRQSIQSAGSPTTPRQTFFSLHVTNADDTEAGSSRGQLEQLEQHGSPKRDRRGSLRTPVIIHVDGGRIEEGTGPRPPQEAPPAYTKRG
jgi:hypothetical protein